jgi:3-hydroxyacyl-[acyl-carrier-protein] dehydratase
MAAYVFLDRVLDCDPGVRVTGLKALAFNEEYFRDHFPGKPVLPGAMLLEGFVQAARHCLAAAEGGHDRWTLHEVKGMRFNRFAVPGEVLKLEADFEKSEDGALWFKGKASAEGDGVCRLRFAVTEYDPG